MQVRKIFVVKDSEEFKTILQTWEGDYFILCGTETKPIPSEQAETLIRKTEI